MMKALIIRLGAFGDMIIMSPVIDQLKADGYYIILNTNQRGKEIYQHDDRIDEFIMHDEDIKYDDLPAHWEALEKSVNPDKCINFTGSLENNVALHPVQPMYIYPKYERYNKCNKNYYDVTIRWAGYYPNNNIPSLKFLNEEEKQAKSITQEGRLNLLWCLSGSGKNKVYPWTEYVMGSLIKDYPDINIITVGDTKCKLLENINHNLPEKNFTELAGEIPYRISMLLTKYADVVVSPDTGILHASGCFETPKVGLLGHTTTENITKYFKNDYSLEADCACAPCFYLIYDHDVQCPIDVITKAAWCMAVGLQPERVYSHIKKAIKSHVREQEVCCTA